MKRLGTLPHILLLGSFIVFLSACTALPAQSTRISLTPTVQSAQASPSPTPPVRQLKPNTPLPASCQASPVNIGGPLGTASPWLQAQPTTSGIVAYLSYSSGGLPGTYRLPHTNGFFPEERLYTKTFWTIDNAQASETLLIEGTDLSDSTRTYHGTGNAVSGPGLPTGRNMHTYTSYLQAPTVGCWRLQITSGRARGTITMWFMG